MKRSTILVAAVFGSILMSPTFSRAELDENWEDRWSDPPAELCKKYQDSLNEAVGQILVDEHGLLPSELGPIGRGEIHRFMRRVAVICSWGEPESINEFVFPSGGYEEQLVYGGGRQFVSIIGGLVHSITTFGR